MDLAVFIGELLTEYGTLSVPGLGKFTQVHVDSHYDEDRGIFFPPHFETTFVEEKSDDEILAQYLSSKKNISITSADYFIDKYVTSLKQQAINEEVRMDDLGWMSFQGLEFTFRPNTISQTYEKEYFGLPTLSVNKIWEQLSGNSRKVAPITEPVAPVAPPPPAWPAEPVRPAAVPVTPPAPVQTPKPIPVPAPVATPAPAPVAPARQKPGAAPELDIFPEVIALKNDVPEAPPKQKVTPKSPTLVASENKPAVSIWIILLIVAVIAGIIAIALYKYRSRSSANDTYAPNTRNHNNTAATPVAGADSMQTAVATNADTIIVKKDTLISTAPAADEAPSNSKSNKSSTTATIAAYQIIDGSFPTMEKANAAVDWHKERGIVATITPTEAGKPISICLGYFNTQAEAESKLKELQAARMVSNKAYVQKTKQ